jgi:hypothetical protein
MNGDPVRRAAVSGALVADAAALGLHWMYNAARLPGCANCGRLRASRFDHPTQPVVRACREFDGPEVSL